MKKGVQIKMAERLDAIRGRMQKVIEGAQCLKWLVTSSVTARFNEDTRSSRVGDAVMNARVNGEIDLWDRIMIGLLSPEDKIEAKSQVAGVVWIYKMDRLGERLGILAGSDPMSERTRDILRRPDLFGRSRPNG